MGCTHSTTPAATTEPEPVVADQTAVHVAAAETNDATAAPLDADVDAISIVGHSVDAKGVVHYHIQTVAIDGHDPAIVKKRFNDFKVFHHGSSTPLPALPSAGLFTAFQRTHEALIRTRSARFQEILRAAPRDHVTAFLVVVADDEDSTPERATTDAEPAAATEPAAQAIEDPAVDATAAADDSTEVSPDVQPAVVEPAAADVAEQAPAAADEAATAAAVERKVSEGSAKAAAAVVVDEKDHAPAPVVA
ncbi:hypothetical protein DYB32_009343 [Aphanomyces invadans]|uniref:PX domain-containing protein n=1 Tax=Aphanomyces invadans TaxID=157072 RepID=A0A3R6YXW1_9STRA|nr:hypothetical protein DYB32_009343 [Aphanomyces invadans]